VDAGLDQVGRRIHPPSAQIRNDCARFIAGGLTALLSIDGLEALAVGYRNLLRTT
jgi:hypothetical protein